MSTERLVSIYLLVTTRAVYASIKGVSRGEFSRIIGYPIEHGICPIMEMFGIRKKKFPLIDW
jgi:hypothetical protein